MPRTYCTYGQHPCKRPDLLRYDYTRQQAEWVALFYTIVVQDPDYETIVIKPVEDHA